MSVIRHAASFKRLGIREGKAPMRVATATLKENTLYCNCLLP
jgi:hypothetical protein